MLPCERGPRANAAIGSSSVVVATAGVRALYSSFLRSRHAAPCDWVRASSALDIQCSVYLALAGTGLERSMAATDIDRTLDVRLVGMAKSERQNAENAKTRTRRGALNELRSVDRI